MKPYKLTAIALACILVLCMSAPALAVSPVNTVLRWDNTSSITLTMSYDGGVVRWSGSVIGHPGTTYIDATFTLSKLTTYGYVELDSWDASANSLILRDSGSMVSSAGTYKLEVAGSTTRYGTSEPFESEYVDDLP